GPCARIGRRPARDEVGGAGGEERAVVGKVVVDRDAPDARAACDLRDRRPRRADLAVQRDGGVDDPLPRLLLAAGALLELVAAHSMNIAYVDLTWCPRVVTVSPI